MRVARRIRLRSPRGAVLAGALLVGTAVVVPATAGRAAPPTRAEAVSTAAAGAAPATRITPPVDVVSIGVSGVMPPAVIATVEDVGRQINAPSVLGRSFNVGLWAVRRAEAPVQLAGEGASGVWQFPMSATALPVEAIGRVMTAPVAAAISQGFVVLNRTSANLRGAQVGDTLDLIAADGNARRFVLGYIAPDAEVGGAELVMSNDQADVLGATRVTRVVLFGQIDRDAFAASLAAHGLVDGEGVRVNASWYPFNPDSVIGSTTVKTLLGEFDYRVNSDDSLSLDPTWVATNVQRVNFSSIGIRASCHRAIVADLQAALDEIAAAGLAFAIDLGNTNTYGGCYNPRFARVSAIFGSVSRHAWAMAIDMNTTANAQGRVPRMDCRVVRIFRKHNFAWGGNFLVPDGMHFEWVGEPRNTVQYPSRYCPNVPGGGIESTPGTTWPAEPARTQRDVLFADPAGGDLGGDIG
ncbi:MAG: M15 family metallopeptidase [Acidimicrobiales bacterium]